MREEIAAPELEVSYINENNCVFLDKQTILSKHTHTHLKQMNNLAALIHII